MAVFTPDVTASGGIESPVGASSSSISGLTSAFNFVTNLNQSAKTPSFTEKEDARQHSLIIGLQEGLLKANQITEQQGTQAGQRYARTVLTNYVRSNGDPSDPMYTSSLSLITGQSPEFVGRSDAEVTQARIKESPEYAGYYQASYAALPDANDQQRSEYAMMKVTQANAVKVAVEDENFQWVSHNGARLSDQIMDDFMLTTVGGLNLMARSESYVNQEDFDMARTEWAMLKDQIIQLRPEDSSLFESTQKRMDNIDGIFETMESIVGVEGINSVFQSRLVEDLYQGLEDGRISTLDFIVGNSLLKSDARALAEAGIEFPSELRDILKGWSISHGSSTSGFDTTQDYSEVDVEDKLNIAKALTGTPMRTPQSVDTSFRSIESAMGAIRSVGDKDRRFMSMEDVDKVFNGDVLVTLERLATTSPERTIGATDMTIEALDAQLATASLVLAEMTRGVQGVTWTGTELVYDRSGTGRGSSNQVAISRRDTEMLENQQRLIQSLQSHKAKFQKFRGTVVAGDDELQGSEGNDLLTSPQVEDTLEFTRQLIRDKEGFRENAYWDVNAWRVGYGSDTTTKADGTVVRVTKDTVVTREDAERDLTRREREFALTASRQVGTSNWYNMPGNVTAALTSVAYNYGSLPKRILPAARSGDWEALATAVEGLAGDNDGINAGRRRKEAALIRGEELPRIDQRVQGVRPEVRPDDLITPEEAVGGVAVATANPQRATESVSTEPSQVSEGVTTGEPTEAALQAAEREWSTLAGETQEFLIRLLGTEEEVKRMIASKQINTENM